MKRSVSIRLTLLNTIALSAATACHDKPVIDPCIPSTFDADGCETAIARRGFYSGTRFVPMMYSQPFFYYQASAGDYLARMSGADVSTNATTQMTTPGAAGGRVGGLRGTAVDGTAESMSSVRSGAVVGRGGFGATGEGHSAAGT